MNRLKKNVKLSSVFKYTAKADSKTMVGAAGFFADYDLLLDSFG